MSANKRPREEQSDCKFEVIQKNNNNNIIILKKSKVEIIEDKIEDKPINTIEDNIKNIKDKLDIIQKQYEESIKNNNELLIKQYNRLGMEYFNQKNYDKAIEYFILSSDLNNSDAQYMLYDIYGKVNKVDSKIYNYNKALNYFKLSLNNNNSYAQLSVYCNIIKLILCKSNHTEFEKICNIKINYEKAIKYLELSANQNNAIAQWLLGKLYIDNLLINLDYIKAFELLEKSSKQNYKFATQQLSILYSNGWGVKKDTEKAKQYFELSFNQSIPKKYSFMDKYK